MAPPSTQFVLPPFVHRIGRYRSLFVPIAFVALLGVIIVPVPPMLMDLLITANIALAALVLMTTMFVERPLDLLSGTGLPRIC